MISPETPAPIPLRRALAATSLLVASTLLGLAGTDLVLPAIPSLPESLGGNLTQAQLVLATFAAGIGVGLVLFGEIGARHDNRRLLAVALLLYGVISLLAARATSVEALIGLRFLQGVAASCAAVLSPGMVRSLFNPSGAMRALGAIGSVESLAPAIAPIIGVWLLAAGGWQLSFHVIGVCALVLSAAVALAAPLFPASAERRSDHSYLMLLRNRVFHRYAWSQGFALGGLLVFVFGMPTVITRSLGGTLNDFIVMQLCGIASFIVAANLANKVAERLGAERTIWLGSVLAVISMLPIALATPLGLDNMVWVTLLFIPFNAGFGLRGPPGFYRALQASGGDDARASALVVLSVMLVTAGGTAAVAPVISMGLWVLALASFGLSLAGLACLRWLPELPGEPLT